MTARASLLCIALLAAPSLLAERPLTVRVLGLFHPHALEVRSASAEPLVLSDSAPRFLLNGERAHRSLLIRAAGDRLLVDGFLFPSLLVSARDGSPARTELIIPARIHRVYRGTLTLTSHHGELTAVVTMDREEAVLSVVASEMPANAPPAALQAQAIVARSFIAAGARHNSFDFCDTTHCQFLRSPDDASPAVRAAVAATRTLVLTWNHRPLAALYSSQCGGRTNTLRDAGMNPGSGYPYYSVSCAWCRAHASRWHAAPPAEASPPQPGNEAARIRYVRQWGWSALPGNRFNASDGPSGAHLEGRAVGHGIGLCQQGAIAMAANGADCRVILDHYYPDTTVEPAP